MLDWAVGLSTIKAGQVRSFCEVHEAFGFREWSSQGELSLMKRTHWS